MRLTITSRHEWSLSKDRGLTMDSIIGMTHRTFQANAKNTGVGSPPVGTKRSSTCFATLGVGNI